MPLSIDELGDKLCDYCPLPDELKGCHCYGGNIVYCEGSKCQEAYQLYLEVNCKHIKCGDKK